MELELIECAQGATLPATSLRVESGTATRVVCETALRPTVLGLIASGRMRPTSGTVTLDGLAAVGTTRRSLQHRTALIDAPGVSEPDARISLAELLSEELALAGLPGDRVAVQRWAQLLGFTSLDRTVGSLNAAERVRALTEIALLRDDIETLVVVLPDRHGGDTAVWWSALQSLAERGFGVLAITTAASEAALQQAHTVVIDTTAEGVAA